LPQILNLHKSSQNIPSLKNATKTTIKLVKINM